MRVHRAGADAGQSHREYFRFQMVDPDDGVAMKLVCLRWMGIFILFCAQPGYRAANPTKDTIAAHPGRTLTCINSGTCGECFNELIATRKLTEAIMYRNLLVHIPTERSPRPAIDGSISLAMTAGAALEAVAVGYESVNDIPLVAEGGVAMAPLFEAQHRSALERARAALAVFEFEAKTAKITHRSRAIGGAFAEAADILGATARLSDLTIVSQPEAMPMRPMTT